MEKLSYFLDSNKQSVFKIEKGEYMPSVTTLAIMAEALGCTICDFFLIDKT